MHPEIEISQMAPKRKGRLLATFSVRLLFNDRHEIHIARMNLLEGAAGPYVEAPINRVGRGTGAVPGFVFNRKLEELVTVLAMEVYERTLVSRSDREEIVLA